MFNTAPELFTVPPAEVDPPLGDHELDCELRLPASGKSSRGVLEVEVEPALGRAGEIRTSKGFVHPDLGGILVAKSKWLKLNSLMAIVPRGLVRSH